MHIFTSIYSAKSSRKSKAKKARQTTHNEPVQSGISALEQYVLDLERYEMIAIGEQYTTEQHTGSTAEQQLEDFDQAWQRASERRDWTRDEASGD